MSRLVIIVAMEKLFNARGVDFLLAGCPFNEAVSKDFFHAFLNTVTNITAKQLFTTAKNSKLGYTTQFVLQLKVTVSQNVPQLFHDSFSGLGIQCFALVPLSKRAT